MEVREKLEQAVEQLNLPPWPAAAAQAHPPACAILARRFGKGLRILAAVAAFEGILAREHLIAIGMDKLVNRQVSLCRAGLPVAAVCTCPNIAAMYQTLLVGLLLLLFLATAMLLSVIICTDKAIFSATQAGN